MKYYKVILENGDTHVYESKESLSNHKIVKGMVEESILSIVESKEVIQIIEITEEEYEEAVI